MSRIHVIHENPEWTGPLFSALVAQGLPYEDWLLDEGALEYRRRTADANETIPLEGACEAIRERLS